MYAYQPLSYLTSVAPDLSRASSTRTRNREPASSRAHPSARAHMGSLCIMRVFLTQRLLLLLLLMVVLWLPRSRGGGREENGGESARGDREKLLLLLLLLLLLILSSLAPSVHPHSAAATHAPSRQLQLPLLRLSAGLSVCVCVGGQRAAHTAQCIAEHSGISRRIEGESSKRVLHLWGEVRVVVGAPRARART